MQGADININDHKILSGINLNIPKNSTVALIGKSGAGKTTLASVITGLLTISNGHLLIDGIELNEYDVTSYRSRIGYVSQDAVIFNESIYNNVTLWTGDTIDDRSFFNEIAELTHLSDLINGLPTKGKYHSW